MAFTVEGARLRFPQLVEGVEEADLIAACRELPANPTAEQVTTAILHAQNTSGGAAIAALGDSYTDQLRHMLRMAGLHNRDWRILAPVVLIDVDNVFLEKCDRMVQACRYQGFDPAVLLRLMVTRWRQGNRQPREVFELLYTEGDEERAWNFTNREDLVEDLRFLIATFLNRGAVVHKILQKSHRSFVAVMRMLCGKYNIRTEDPGQGRRRAQSLGPEVVTLPRIAAVFSQLTVTMFHAGFGRALTAFPLLANMPLGLFSPMFPSVVSRTVEGPNAMRNIHPQLVYISILNDNVLHQRDRVTPLDQIWNYYLASFNSTVLRNAQRMTVCRDIGVVDGNHFLMEIVQARQRCKDAIRELRPHDRIEEILAEMDAIN